MIRILCTVLCMMLTGSAFALGNGQTQVVTMLSSSITTDTSPVFTPWSAKKTFHAKGTTSAGAGAAVIKIEAADTNSSVTADWITLGTISLTLATTSTGDGFSVDSPWRFVRSRVSSISGTDATVSVYMSAESNK